jgi:transposase-like protein
MASKRKHSPEFRVSIVKRMLAGENISALSAEHGLPRSMMYRWRDTYRKYGAEGLERPGASTPASKPAKRVAPRPPSAQSPPSNMSDEERLRGRIAELERKVGRQAEEIDFFKGVFKRLDELPKAKRRGGEASTRRSDA